MVWFYHFMNERDWNESAQLKVQKNYFIIIGIVCVYKINAYDDDDDDGYTYIRTQGKKNCILYLYLKPLIISNMYLNRLKVWKTIRLTKYSASYASVLCGLIVAVNFFFLNVSRTGFFCIFISFFFIKKNYFICLYTDNLFIQKNII